MVTRVRSFALLFVLLVIAGCGISTYYQPGASFAALERDTATCEAEAWRLAPEDIRTRRVPEFEDREVCSGGKCQTRRVLIGYDIEYVDVNKRLRADLETQCFARKGYVRVRLPECPLNVIRATPAGRTTVMPPLTENTCAFRTPDGSLRIVRASSP